MANPVPKHKRYLVAMVLGTALSAAGTPAVAAEGRAVLMISSELPEIIGMSDRVLVMSRGRVVTDLSRSQMDSESIMRAAFDVNLEPSPGTDRSDQPGPS